MAADLNLLVPAFKEKVIQLLESCNDAGYKMIPTETIRTPIRQAQLWRQSRTTAVIQQKIADLQDREAGFLAQCIIDAGPQNGDHVTNSIPGLSWHQWGESVDCVWIVNDEEEWSETKLVNGQNGYHVYAGMAKELGLTAGGFWTSFKDWPHVQLHQAASPAGDFSLKQINDIMKERFS